MVRKRVFATMGLSVRNNEGCCEYILNCPLSDWTAEFNPSSNLKLGPMYFIMYTFTSSGHLTVSSHSITFSLYKEHNFFLMYHLYWETAINMYRYFSSCRLIVAVDRSFMTTYETYRTRKQRFTRLYWTGYFFEFVLCIKLKTVDCCHNFCVRRNNRLDISLHFYLSDEMLYFLMKLMYN